jgi:hypothetical protein
MSRLQAGSVDTSALDPDQRSSELAKDLPRAKLTRPVLAALWVLRIYVVIAVPLIVYVFLRSLRG